MSMFLICLIIPSLSATHLQQFILPYMQVPIQQHTTFHIILVSCWEVTITTTMSNFALPRNTTLSQSLDPNPQAQKIFKKTQELSQMGWVLKVYNA